MSIRGFNACYVRLPRLLQEIAVGRGDGSYTRHLARLAHTDLLVIDDWLLAPLKDTECRDPMEFIENCSEHSSPLIASQLPSEDWHAVIGDFNQADALRDKILHRAHRLTLDGPSIRQTRKPPKVGME